jgi:hypothetical protein
MLKIAKPLMAEGLQANRGYAAFALKVKVFLLSYLIGCFISENCYHTWCDAMQKAYKLPLSLEAGIDPVAIKELIAVMNELRFARKERIIVV